jgi:hypothetical protein
VLEDPFPEGTKIGLTISRAETNLEGTSVPEEKQDFIRRGFPSLEQVECGEDACSGAIYDVLWRRLIFRND